MIFSPLVIRAVNLPTGGVRLAIWKLWPVSRPQIARAQWALAVVAPLAVLIAGMIASLGVAGATGHLQVSWFDPAAILAAQSLMVVALQVGQLDPAGGTRIPVRALGLLGLLLVVPFVLLAWNEAWAPGLRTLVLLPGGLAIASPWPVSSG